MTDMPSLPENEDNDRFDIRHLPVHAVINDDGTLSVIPLPVATANSERRSPICILTGNGARARLASL
jgi:hypothetical protein